MNKKELRFAFNEVLRAVETLKCSNLHHPAKHQHEHHEVCKAEYHLARQAHILREYMKQQGL